MNAAFAVERSPLRPLTSERTSWRMRSKTLPVESEAQHLPSHRSHRCHGATKRWSGCRSTKASAKASSLGMVAGSPFFAERIFSSNRSNTSSSRSIANPRDTFQSGDHLTQAHIVLLGNLLVLE